VAYEAFAEQRRRAILAATIKVLGEHGVKGLSFRTIGAELGGSTTMVTHYYPTQAELIGGLADAKLLDWESELAEIEESVSDPHDRLVAVLEWLVPTDEIGGLEDRARIALLAQQLAEGSTKDSIDAWERFARRLLRRHLEPIVPKGEVALHVDMLRSLTNGLSLSVVEHPDHWTKRRVLKVLRRFIDQMGLGKPGTSKATP
jgi:AcrR family transcriptional regulator